MHAFLVFLVNSLSELEIRLFTPLNDIPIRYFLLRRLVHLGNVDIWVPIFSVTSRWSQIFIVVFGGCLLNLLSLWGLHAPVTQLELMFRCHEKHLLALFHGRAIKWGLGQTRHLVEWGVQVFIMISRALLVHLLYFFLY